ncbi:hypothetical protein D7V97_19305 [Corallococcus sp. CA053C]|nr:hypothetical protein D7V97_19305 [Corallococcus sp. CA053C]
MFRTQQFQQTVWLWPPCSQAYTQAAISGVMLGTGASIAGLEALADAPPTARPNRNTVVVISFLFIWGILWKCAPG